MSNGRDSEPKGREVGLPGVRDDGPEAESGDSDLYGEYERDLASRLTHMLRHTPEEAVAIHGSDGALAVRGADTARPAGRELAALVAAGTAHLPPTGLPIIPVSAAGQDGVPTGAPAASGDAAPRPPRFLETAGAAGPGERTGAAAKRSGPISRPVRRDPNDFADTVPSPRALRGSTSTPGGDWLAHQLRSAAYGLAFGLLVIVPMVLILTERHESLLAQFMPPGANRDAASRSSMVGPRETSAPTRDVAIEPPETGRAASAAEAPALDREVAREPDLAPPARPPGRLPAEPLDTALAPTASVPAATAPPSAPATAPASVPPSPAAASSATPSADTAAPAATSMARSLTPAAPAADPGLSADLAAPSPEIPPRATTPPAPRNMAAIDSPSPLPAQPSAVPQPVTSPATPTSLPPVPPPSAARAAEPPPTSASLAPPTAPVVVEPAPAPASAAAPSIARLSPPTPAAPSSLEVLAESERRIRQGDILGARGLLARAAATGDPAAMLALGETFDPNMLAAWGARDATSDVGTARLFYERALAAGLGRAKVRLQGLE